MTGDATNRHAKRGHRGLFENQHHCGMSAKYKGPSKWGQSYALFVLLSFRPTCLKRVTTCLNFSLIERARQKARHHGRGKVALSNGRRSARTIVESSTRACEKDRESTQTTYNFVYITQTG